MLSVNKFQGSFKGPHVVHLALRAQSWFNASPILLHTMSMFVSSLCLFIDGDQNYFNTNNVSAVIISALGLKIKLCIKIH